MMILLFFLTFYAFDTISQDELFFKNHLLPSVDNTDIRSIEPSKLSVKSYFYEIDLNQDGQNEFVRTEKVDGQDYIVILNSQKVQIKRQKFSAIGFKSSITKILLKKLNPTKNVMIVFHNEGEIKSHHYYRTGRAYFFTYDVNDLTNIHVYKGPHLFYEFDDAQKSYVLRDFGINTYDYNNDGVNEIAVAFKNINKIYFYLGENRWRKI